ncbi:MAG: ABC transporter substrate-binding protein, partial [Deltaproteobacteria bacterium]|nr:ABC transporter substrate-binding protein [Candidatus Tharpella sp.]
GRTYRMANPILGDLPIIGSRNKPQPEKIIGARPDIILLGSGGERFARQLERQTAIPVIIVASGDLSGNKQRFYRSLELLGTICGVKKRSRAVCDKIEAQIAELARRTQNLAPAERKRVYVGGLQFKVAHGILGTSCSYPPFEMVNADNVVDHLTVQRKLIRGRFTIKKETFINLDPDVLFICESGLSMVGKELDEPLYQSLKVRRCNQIYLLMPHYYGADPATVLSEAWYIGKILYPDRFSDIEIADVADQLYTFFVGRPLYQEMVQIFGGFTKLSELKCPQ